MNKYHSKKVTVRFSEKMKKEMHHHMVLNGYNLHEKSKWVIEAIHEFLHLPGFHELVEHGITVNQGELVTMEAFYIPIETLSLIKDAVLVVRKQKPLLEGVQSAVVRSSVINKLIHRKA